MTLAKNFPLYLCLTISMLLFGVLTTIGGSILLDWSEYPESSVQFVHWAKGQFSSLPDEDKQKQIDEVEEHERNLHTVLMSVGIFSIIFGLITTLMGLDICYMLCFRKKRKKAKMFKARLDKTKPILTNPEAIVPPDKRESVLSRLRSMQLIH